MRQARTIRTRIGEVIEQEYLIIFEHNHSQVWRDGKLIYDGYETEGYKQLDKDIAESKKIAELIGLKFEVVR